MTRAVNVFLLNLDPASDLGPTLEKIVESFTNLRVSLRKGSFSKTSLQDIDVEAISIDFNPDAFFLVLSPAHLGNLGPLVSFISERLSDRRVMLIVEESEPEKLAELARLHGVEFMTPPLNAAEVLARLVRLLDMPVPIPLVRQPPFM